MSFPSKALAQKAYAENRHSTRVVDAQQPTLQLKSVNADENIPEDQALVILTAGDVWGDGSGYQMLLDDDATAYGTIH